MNLKFNNENMNPRMPLSRYIRNADNINREKNSSNNSIHDNGDYKLENIIGQGQFASVRVCKHKISGQRFAMKTYLKSKVDSTNLKREIGILEQLDHPNIIKLRDTFEDAKNINLVLDYVSSMNLQQFIQNRSLQETQVKIIFTQLISAINYMHSKNIYHRDIKLDNILYGQKQLSSSIQGIALIDFGFAIQTEKICQVPCGTPNFMAPELLQKRPYRPQFTDIWACGVVLHLLLFGNYPKQGKVVPVHSSYQKILKGCFELNADKRWTAEKILQELSQIQ